MPFPENILVRLLEIDGSSCGVLQHNLVERPNSNPQSWWSTGQSGDFAYAEIVPLKSGSDVVDYTLKIVYLNPPSTCHGVHTFHLSAGPTTSPTQADPIGDYCLGSSGSTVCGDGKASAEDNDP